MRRGDKASTWQLFNSVTVSKKDLDVIVFVVVVFMVIVFVVVVFMVVVFFVVVFVVVFFVVFAIVVFFCHHHHQTSRQSVPFRNQAMSQTK